MEKTVYIKELAKKIMLCIHMVHVNENFSSLRESFLICNFLIWQESYVCLLYAVHVVMREGYWLFLDSSPFFEGETF